MKPALLVLRSGRVFRGEALGAEGEAWGEVIFNTAMSGYQEILTDPSYEGQLVAMTYPEIGNVGVNAADCESSRPYVRGFIVREHWPEPSSWRAETTLDAYMAENG
ncbi:MAG: carbamoyl phosphate synthase small subunit, partial [Candidatus Rokubacteria bacterium]|nr:carbamoyl phosphate synthase small subunit [Candidatus Rokubacteria bacterium]